MRKLVLAGLMASLTASAALADRVGSPAMGQTAAPRAMAPMPAPAHPAWGQRVNGRWSGGWNAPGGWGAYRRPVTGFVLPPYWINDGFYIGDYRSYGLPAPAAGYGWSRYYDDAVLTDRYGRVVDARYGYDWDRYGGYAEAYAPPPAYAYPEDRRGRNDALIGAGVGGVAGGLAGAAIAGRGNRTGGAVLGAGVGAIAGAALADSGRRHRRENGAYGVVPDQRYSYGAPRGGPLAPQSGYDYGAGDDGLSLGGRTVYDGQWVGTWYGRDGASYSGVYDGTFKGEVHGHWNRDAYAPPPPAIAPAPPIRGYGFRENYERYDDGHAYEGAWRHDSSYGYYAADAVAPFVTTTTTITEETVATGTRRRIVRRAHPRPRVACSCSCRC